MQPSDDIISCQRRSEQQLALGVGFLVGGAFALLIMLVALSLDEKCSALQQPGAGAEVRIMRCDLQVQRGASSLDAALTDVMHIESN